jgi:hypothetical protein
MEYLSRNPTSISTAVPRIFTVLQTGSHVEAADEPKTKQI